MIYIRNVRFGHLRFIGFGLLSLFIILGCSSTKLISQEGEDAEYFPNILWITVEDISPTLSMYGDSTAHTPHLNELASQSMIYDNAFSTVGVCAPARSSIITGMYPTSIGTMHMRTGKDVASWGKREYKPNTGIYDLAGEEVAQYSAVVPFIVKCFSEYMRAIGYYCTNNAKTDYQFAAPLSAWDENDNKAHWRNAPEGRPFFSIFNINKTHESKLWKHKDKPLTVSPESVIVPPYLPDNVEMRNTIARHYSNVELMDIEVGKIINQLKEDGLYESTIIFFFSDHGGPLPREKREAYDSGLHVPFMVKGIDSKEKGRNDRLISFVDLAPTMQSITGLSVYEYMDGYAFLGEQEEPARSYVFGSGDRFDEYTDRVRIIRTDSFLYVKNYYQDMSGYKDIGYRKNVPGMNQFLDLKKEAKLNEVQKQWFDLKKSEELYAVHSDPHNINDLSDSPKYQTKLAELRGILVTHQKEYGDMAEQSESAMINDMWPNKEQPKTKKPSLIVENNIVKAKSEVWGASISYKVSKKPITNLVYDNNWQLYTDIEELQVESGMYVNIVAGRIGFKPSDIVSKKIP